MSPGGGRRPLLVGIVAVAAYLVVAVATLGGGAHVRPLFDGFAPPPPYRWVNPPKAFASTNVKPTPETVEAPLGANGSAIRGIATGDGQFVLSLPEGAVPPRAGEATARIDVAPLDPATLGPLPAGLRTDGNAYRATVTYRPSAQPVATLVRRGSLQMTVPEPSEVLLFSPDGRAWTQLTTRNLTGPVTPESTFDQPGYYLGALPKSAAEATSGGGSGTADKVVAVAVITVVLVLGLWLLPAVVRRARRR